MIDISLVTLGDPGRTTGGYLYHRRVAEAASNHDARIRFVSFAERPFPLPVAEGPAMMRRLRSMHPQVIALDSIAAAFVAPWLAAGSLETAVVAVLHQPPGGIDHGPLRTAAQARLDRAAYRRARALIAASESLKDQLIEDGYDPARIHVVPPGRDVAAFPSDERLELRSGAKVAFLCVGNWLPRKGIVELLDAFSTLPRELGVLHLVGDDRADLRYAGRVADRLREPDLRNRVFVHGLVPRDRVAAFYRDADVFVLASMKEPYGTAYGEAMAYGLPVVGWRAGNLPYLAGHLEEGLIVDPHDTAGLARALEEIARSDDLRRRLGQGARDKAERFFITWEDTARLFFAVIRDVAPP
jgi:glycosyltransferase involved in cell wall biosynthesis